MQEVTIYQGSQEITIVEAVPPQERDAAFLASWLFGKSEKTQAAYTADMQKFSIASLASPYSVSLLTIYRPSS